jgi:hypothetical protein
MLLPMPRCPCWLLPLDKRFACARSLLHDVAGRGRGVEPPAPPPPLRSHPVRALPLLLALVSDPLPRRHKRRAVVGLLPMPLVLLIHMTAAACMT